MKPLLLIGLGGLLTMVSITVFEHKGQIGPICIFCSGGFPNPSAPEIPKRADAKEFHGDDALAPFFADCRAHGGKVYTAEEWNALRPGANLSPGQLHCHRDASWSVDR